MTEAERLEAILNREGFTCVVSKNGRILTSYDRGIRPVLQWIENDIDAVRGAVVCDKVVGKAAALLFVYGGIGEILAGVVSVPALEVFKAHGIVCVYRKLVSRIQNRDQTGLCPMEERAIDLTEPEEAYTLFSQIVKKTESKRQEESECSIGD